MPSPCIAAASPVPAILHTDPVITLGSSNAWRAGDVSTSGGFTTQWNPYVGAVALTSVGTQQAVPTADSRLGSQLSVPFAGTGAYKGVITAPGLNQTIMVIHTTSATTTGQAALVLSAANSGTSILNTGSTSGNVSARRLSVDCATGAKAYTFALITIGVYTGSDIKLYANAKTPITLTNSASGFSQATFVLGALDASAATWPHKGTIARAAVFPTALTAAQAALLLAYYGSYYAQTIAA